MSPHRMTTVTATELDAMTAEEVKVAENRLRRAASRQGLALRKSRARDPRAIDYGRYYLVGEDTVVASEHDDLLGVQEALLASD